MTIEILSSQVLVDVPSASGIVKSDDIFYVIGDNSPFLFKLDQDFRLISKTPIYLTKNLDGEVFLKKIKPDFEAMEMVSENEIIVLGSGSKSPQRNICLRVAVETPKVMAYDISPFYDHLKKLDVMQDQELNIEAAAFHSGQIYLFNRGRNVIFSFKYKELMDHFEGSSPCPIPKTTAFDLPKINGIEAGFSGAATFQNKPLILFTASVENTKNAYDDGEILGSFIGTIEIKNNEIVNSYQSVLLPNHGPPAKVESIAIDQEISEAESNVILVTDNDGEHSTLIKCRLKW